MLVTTEVERNSIPLQVIICQISIKFCCQLTQNMTTFVRFTKIYTDCVLNFRLFFQIFLNLTKSVVVFWGKVLSLLEACFDLISGSSLHMKIQIMGGKITENLGFKSPLRKVKKILSFFLFIFKFSI
jgi:hypothetical protein